MNEEDYALLGYKYLTPKLKNKNIRMLRTVTFDFEATDIEIDKARVIQVAAILSEAGHLGANVIDTFSTFVNPGEELSEFTVDYTGITDQMVADAPPFEEVLPELLDFMTRADFISGHNIIRYDLPLLKEEARRAGYDLDLNMPVFDTWLFEWRRRRWRKSGTSLIKSAKAHAVGRVARIVAGEKAAHDALNDAEMNADLVWEMCKETVVETTLSQVQRAQVSLMKKLLEEQAREAAKKEARDKKKDDK